MHRDHSQHLPAIAAHTESAGHAHSKATGLAINLNTSRWKDQVFPQLDSTHLQNFLRLCAGKQIETSPVKFAQKKEKKSIEKQLSQCWPKIEKAQMCFCRPSSEFPSQKD